MLKSIYLILSLFLFVHCNNQKNIQILIENNSDIPRQNETIELKLNDLKNTNPGFSVDAMQVFDTNNQQIISQKIDENLDGKADLLIFQTDMAAHDQQTYILKPAQAPVVQSKTFARFVPERENDFAWENDRIAFRMYSRQLSEKESVDSGIDVWVKSVPYLIIDKWYKGEDYHKDHGEGLDFYKVGPSRGCGGSAVLHQGKIQLTGGFESYKVIANGPVRSMFELRYNPFEIDGIQYSEIRRISIDAGWNFNKVECIIETENPLNIAVGLKIQGDPQQAVAVKDSQKGFISLWEKISDENGSLGTSIIINPDKLSGFDIIDDQHILITKKEEGKRLTYYTGAGWSKSTYFDTQDQWNTYVEETATRLNNPVIIKIKN